MYVLYKKFINYLGEKVNYKRTKLEDFLLTHNATADIESCGNETRVTIYTKCGLYLYAHYAPTLNEAITLAVDDFLNKKDQK